MPDGAWGIVTWPVLSSLRSQNVIKLLIIIAM